MASDDAADGLTPFLGSREGFLLKVGRVRKVRAPPPQWKRGPWKCTASNTSSAGSRGALPLRRSSQSIHERWFVMCRMKLAYYKFRDTDRTPIRVMDLLQCSRIERLENQRRPNCFVCVAAAVPPRLFCAHMPCGDHAPHPDASNPLRAPD